MAFLTSHYDPFLVIASILVATLSAYVMLDFARRASSGGRRCARAMLVAGSLSMGTGIWSMHFIGMLAYSLPIPLGYTYPMTVLSWLASVAACFVALKVAGGAPSPSRLIGGALAMAAAVCAMHYMGMAALDLSPGIVWNTWLVAASAVVAFGASAAALGLCLRLRQLRPGLGTAGRIGAAAFMGLATSGVHYTGMAAANVHEGVVCCSAGLLDGGGLGTLALFASLTMLALTLAVSAWDARVQRRAVRLANALKRANLGLRSANATLRQQAQIDALTGLPNRQGFEARLVHALARLDAAAAARDGRDPGQLAVLFVDLDRFGPVNDSLGHAAGDQLLQQVATRLERAVGPGDSVARVGGDGFLVLTQGPADTGQASALAERLVQTLGVAFEVLDRQLNISASIGVALYPLHGPRSQLVAHAVVAMRAAKRRGGATCMMFDSTLAGAALDELKLQNELGQAIERRQLSLHYQPKVDARHGQIHGVEALLRWQHPELGFVGPDRFIPLAERSGLIIALGNWVIDEACRQMQVWADAGMHMRVAINVSAHQLRSDDLALRIGQALDRHRLDPSQLLCEITESVAMDDIGRTQCAIEALRGIGVYLSIDDFGTGYSSLGALRQLPVTQLKIDRSFVCDLESGRGARTIVDAVIRLAHALGLRVVAEGVETVGQREALVELGCDELQGYLFARPMPAEALLAWAHGHKPAGSVDFSPSIVDEWALA